MQTTAPPPTPANPQPLPDTARLVVTFPLNGTPRMGYEVYIVDEGTDLERYAIRDRTHHDRPEMVGERYTIGAAVAYCLANSGWGSHRIELEQ